MALKPLVWTERDQWQLLPARFTTLDKSGFLQPPGGAALRDTEFVLNKEQGTTDLKAAEWVSQHFDESGGSPTSLEALHRQSPENFYITYLMARASDDVKDQARWLEQAFADVPLMRGLPGTIVLRFVDQQNQPLAGFDLGTIGITFAQVVDGVLDDSLELLYPNLVTDEQGRVFLPVYPMPMKLTTTPELKNFKIIWPTSEAWMIWPGQVGSPRPLVVKSQ